MSIGPVQNLGPDTVTQAGKANLPAEPSSANANPQAAEKPASPATGILQNQKAQNLKNLPSPAELPQDEVQVQRDSQVRDEVVVRYLDKATGALILQVPSAEVLDVGRGIYQQFEQQAKVRDSAEAATVADQGEKSNGH